MLGHMTTLDCPSSSAAATSLVHPAEGQLEYLINQTPRCLLRAFRFFVSWQGVLTLAFRWGLPPGTSGFGSLGNRAARWQDAVPWRPCLAPIVDACGILTSTCIAVYCEYQHAAIHMNCPVPPESACTECAS